MESSQRLMIPLLVCVALWHTVSGQGAPYHPAVRYAGPPYNAPPTYMAHRARPNNRIVYGPPIPNFRPRPMYSPPPPPPLIPRGQSSYDRPVVVRMRRKRPVIIMEEAEDSAERPIIIRTRAKKSKRRKIAAASADNESSNELSRISQLLRNRFNDPYGTQYKDAGTYHLNTRGDLIGMAHYESNEENDVKATGSTEVEYR